MTVNVMIILSATVENGKCTKCVDGYSMVYGNSWEEDEGWKEKEVNEDGLDVCKTCKDGYSMESYSKQCYENEGCKEKEMNENGYEVCKTCKDGYYFESSSDKTCVKDNNCNSANDNGLCGSCRDGYYIVNGAFKQLEHCIGKDDNWHCNKCEDGYTVSSINALCLENAKCTKTNSFGICIECENGFEIEDSEGGVCKRSAEESNNGSDNNNSNNSSSSGSINIFIALIAIILLLN